MVPKPSQKLGGDSPVESTTIHKSNFQWISISFMGLYMFKCDVYMLNCSLIKRKRFLCFYLFLEMIFATLALKVFLKKSYFLCWKTWCFAISWLILWVDATHRSRKMKWENSVLLEFHAESFAAQLQVLRDLFSNASQLSFDS